MTNCKPFRPNPHGYCSFFLLPRASRRRNVIGSSCTATRHERPTRAMVTTYNRGRPQARGKESGKLMESKQSPIFLLQRIALVYHVIKRTLPFVCLLLS